MAALQKRKVVVTGFLPKVNNRINVTGEPIVLAYVTNDRLLATLKKLEAQGCSLLRSENAA